MRLPPLPIRLERLFRVPPSMAKSPPASSCPMALLAVTSVLSRWVMVQMALRLPLQSPALTPSMQAVCSIFAVYRPDLLSSTARRFSIRLARRLKSLPLSITPERLRRLAARLPASSRAISSLPRLYTSP
ncbi:Uncharacterised protein [Acinetobacter baumannii]|nr:Uncharacterised protein [Acinetobacter baumannii]